ncbi:uncharacterized protein B0H18DRAFT_995269 [Fomitopsis serialis]|uniref:uncharacterized protein n=1 Tax=Fomitopsis serialis TaxID=139415 RepID=UPI002007ACB5|nr:uncharacterized protein B0H18DRAFT_995269 [Neoantrodia serialis]KAH9930113.1 hypothetical protein B0H18DRAFT_995269 [Neoantrodia serialis]
MQLSSKVSLRVVLSTARCANGHTPSEELKTPSRRPRSRSTYLLICWAKAFVQTNTPLGEKLENIRDGTETRWSFEFNRVDLAKELKEVWRAGTCRRRHSSNISRISEPLGNITQPGAFSSGHKGLRTTRTHCLGEGGAHSCL